MNNRKLNQKFAVFIFILLAGLAITADAQNRFKGGDKVEVIDTDNPGTWITGTVVLFDNDGGYGHRGQYSVQVDGKTYNYNGWRSPNDIRAAGAAPPKGPGDVVTAPKTRFKKGDRVEVVDTDNPGGAWIEGIVILFDDDNGYGHLNQYSVQVDGKTYNYNGWRKPNEIRTIGVGGPIKDPPPIDPVGGPPANNGGPLKVGDRVDVYLIGGKEGKERGTILEINGGLGKVHPDGCAPYWDRNQTMGLLKPAATIAANAPEIKFFVGKWDMTTVGIGPDTMIAPRAVVWAKIGGIFIEADGTYVWYPGANKAPASGKWEPHAKIPNTQFGTEVLDGILITDVSGQLWKMTRRISPYDKADHITIRLMCSGENEIGTRVK